MASKNPAATLPTRFVAVSVAAVKRFHEQGNPIGSRRSIALDEAVEAAPGTLLSGRRARAASRCCCCCSELLLLRQHRHGGGRMDAALEITAHNTHTRTDHNDDDSSIGF